MGNYFDETDEARIISWVTARKAGCSNRAADKYVYLKCRQLGLGCARKMERGHGSIDDLDYLADEVASYLIVEVLPGFRPGSGKLFSYLSCAAIHYLSLIWRRRVQMYTQGGARKMPDITDITDQLDVQAGADDLVDQVDAGFAAYCASRQFDLLGLLNPDLYAVCYLLPGAMIAADQESKSADFGHRVIADIKRRTGLSVDAITTCIRTLLQEYINQ